MALQSSGQISISDIATEFGVLPSNASLTSFSSLNVNQNSTSKPDGSQPHSISEFYGYDHNAVGAVVLSPFFITSFSGDPNEVCFLKAGERFKTGDPERIFEGDFFYEDEAGTIPITVGRTPFSSYFNGDFGKVVFEYSEDMGVINSFVQPCGK